MEGLALDYVLTGHVEDIALVRDENRVRYVFLADIVFRICEVELWCTPHEPILDFAFRMKAIAADLASGATEASLSFTEYVGMIAFRRLGGEVEITATNDEDRGSVVLSALLDAVRGFAPRVVADLRDAYPAFAANPVATKLVSELLHA